MKAFEDIFDVSFTARMEDELDEIEEGKLTWRSSVQEFWDRFEVDLDKAADSMVSYKAGIPNGREMREVRPGRTARAHQPPRIFPRLLALSRLRFHPRSRRARPRRYRGETGTIYCDNCGKEMAIKRGRFGTFLACTGYPNCKTTRRLASGTRKALQPDVVLDEKCPTDGGDLAAPRRAASAISSAARIIRSASTRARSRSASNARSATKANSFAAAPPRDKDAAASSTAARRYPDCDFTTPYEPLPEPCPKCGAPFIVEKRTKQGNFRSCIRENCDWEIVAPEAPPAQAPVSPQASPTFVHPQEPGAEPQPVGAGAREKP